MIDEKRAAIELIERLPDAVSVEDIIEELYFKLQIDEGMRDVVDGRTLSQSELRERMQAWRKSAAVQSAP